MKPNTTNNANPHAQHIPSKSHPPLPSMEEYMETLATTQRESLFYMIRSMSLQRAVGMLQVLHNIELEVLDHLEELVDQHEDGDVNIYIPKNEEDEVTIYIPKGMMDAAGIAMGDPMDIEMDEDGMYISKAKDIGDPDSLFSKFLSFLKSMEAEDEE